MSGPPPEPTRYPSLAEVAEAIGCSDLEDLGTGGNAGLRAFGVCYVGPHNLDIYLLTDQEAWERALAELFPHVVGPGWIIVSPSGLEAARYVQSRIGGDLLVPPSSSP